MSEAVEVQLYTQDDEDYPWGGQFREMIAGFATIDAMVAWVEMIFERYGKPSPGA